MKSKKTYIYRYGEYVGEAESAIEAANLTSTSIMAVHGVISKKTKMTRSGWTFSYEPLSDDYLEELSAISERKKENKKKLEKEKEVSSERFHIPRTINGKKEKIMQLYISDLAQCRYPKAIALLKVDYMKELIKAI